MVVQSSFSHLMCCDQRTRALKANLVYLVILARVTGSIHPCHKDILGTREGDQASFSGAVDSAVRRH